MLTRSAAQMRAAARCSLLQEEQHAVYGRGFLCTVGCAQPNQMLLLQTEHAVVQQQLAVREAELATASEEGRKLAGQKQELDRQFVKANQSIQARARVQVVRRGLLLRAMETGAAVVLAGAVHVKLLHPPGWAAARLPWRCPVLTIGLNNHLALHAGA